MPSALHEPPLSAPTIADMPLPLCPTPDTCTVACHIDFGMSSVASRAQLPSLPPDLQPQHSERTVRCGPGSVVGEVDFMLQRPCRWGIGGCSRGGACLGIRSCGGGSQQLLLLGISSASRHFATPQPAALLMTTSALPWSSSVAASLPLWRPAAARGASTGRPLRRWRPRTPSHWRCFSRWS